MCTTDVYTVCAHTTSTELAHPLLHFKIRFFFASRTMTKIATHNGKFHADEVFAVSLLRNLDRFKTAEIVRSRDAQVLAGADVVLDVGGVYDPATHRYDHHQPEFKDAFSPVHKTLLSSAGLVYKHFGREILGVRAAGKLSEAQVEALYVHVYESFVEPFDANDNGISAYPADVKPIISRGFDIFSHVNLLNPGWNEAITPESSNQSFMKAVEVVSGAFDLYLNNCLNFWLPARDIVTQALDSKTVSSVDAVSSKILLLPTSCPWKDHLFNTAGTEDILYLIYPEGANASWRIQAVPESPDSFKSRLPLPEAWRGLRDAELDAVLQSSGVESGAIFIHRSGFIGGHKTEQGALAMARLAVELGSESESKKARTD